MKYVQTGAGMARGCERSECFIIKEQLKMLFGKCLHISPEKICSASASGRNQYFNWYSDCFSVTQFIDDWMKKLFSIRWSEMYAENLLF